MSATQVSPFSTSVPFMDKPGCWFLQAKCLKNTCDRWHLHLYLKVTLPQVFFKHFASKKQLPGFYVSGTLVKNRLVSSVLFFLPKWFLLSEGIDVVFIVLGWPRSGWWCWYNDFRQVWLRSLCSVWGERGYNGMFLRPLCQF